MPGPLSRLRERVGVRVFACRQGFVSHEHPRRLPAPGARRETPLTLSPSTSLRTGLSKGAMAPQRGTRFSSASSRPRLAGGGPLRGVKRHSCLTTNKRGAT